jgi:hypothetical protein
MAPVLDRAETRLPTDSDPLSAARRRITETAVSPLVLQAVRLARAGDRGALRFLSARYADDVYDHALTISSGHEQAGEVTLRVFAELDRLIERYDESDAFPAWLRQTAGQVAAEHETR